jgi:Divergent InlB B-repeat domain
VRRLTILLASMAALMLVPVAAANAATGTVKIEGTGSGELVPVPGEEATAGTPPINCKYTSPGPTTGTCTTTTPVDEGVHALKVKAIPAAGSELVEWKVVKGTKISKTCEATNPETKKDICGAFSFGTAIEIKAIFTAVPKDVHITIAGSGSGKVLGMGGTPGNPKVECEWNGTTATGVCDTTSQFKSGFFGITVKHEAAPGSEFTGWTVEEGFPIGCEDPLAEGCGVVKLEESEEIKIKATFALEASTSEFPLSVTKEGTGAGTVTSSPAGINCGSECSEEYEEGTEVTLSASAAEGSTFTGWSGSGCSGTGTCKVTMSAAKSVTATFTLEPPAGPVLTVTPEGTGSGTVVSNSSGIECDPTCSAPFTEGSKVTLTASPSAGSVFVSWKGCEKGGAIGRQCTVTMDKAKTVNAKFTTAYDVKVTRVGSGLGKVGSSPSGVLCLANCSSTTALFKEGTSVTLTATPSKNYVFTEWTGDCSGSGTCSLPTLAANKSVGAKFSPVAQHDLALTKSGGGNGTVKATQAGINCGVTCSAMSAAYYQGAEVELTVTPGKGSSFGGWSTGSGTCTGTTNPCKVTMSSAKAVTAEFK